MKKHTGVIVPMVTPLTEDLKTDHHHLDILLDHLTRHGCHPFAFGTTGEGLSVSMAERRALIKTLVKYRSESIRIYVSVSAVSAADMIDLARHCGDAGVDAVVAHLPPQYPLSPDAMLGWFEGLADRSPCPVILYNIVSTTHMSIPLEVIDRLSRHPNVAGLKDSERDRGRLTAALKMWKDREDFSYFTGWSAVSAEALFYGADGIVPSTGNILPAIYRSLTEAAHRGEVEEAERLQKISDEVGKLYQHGRNLAESLSALKVLLHSEGLTAPYVLPPLTRMKAGEEMELLERFREYKEGLSEDINLK